ncbi:unnamed protein product [Moneuplotes crassus]|uniref:Translation initiation factor 5A C-terminal domain-containing protein n=1 Tax=Euplotes crassus TaxID=5936 RepID=A0AAD1YA50_EUPCR|nr:unnamed protein product [Moneuplotes crassus]
MDSADLEKIEADKLDKESLVMINGNPCKVVKISKIRTSKYGPGKTTIVAYSILDGKKVEQSFRTSGLLDTPIIKRVEYPLLGIDDGYLQLQDEAGEQKDDVKLPLGDCLKDVKDQILKFNEEEIPCLVMVMEYMGVEVSISVREDKDSDEN